MTRTVGVGEYLKALLFSYVHDFRYMLSGKHLSITAFSETHSVVLIACTCGQVFYKLESRPKEEP